VYRHASRRCLLRRTVSLALLALPSLGCEIFAPSGCDAIIVFGLIVRVRSAQTGAPAGAGAVVTATEGNYVETLVGFDGLVFQGAQERSGVYTIAVNAPGYQPWTMQNVEVEDGSCHVKPETVDASVLPVGN